MFQVLFVDLCQDTNTNVSVFIHNLAIGVRKESRFSEEENIIGNFLKRRGRRGNTKQEISLEIIQIQKQYKIQKEYKIQIQKYKIGNLLKGVDDEEIQNRWRELQMGIVKM